MVRFGPGSSRIARYLGDLARVAARTLTALIRATTGLRRQAGGDEQPAMIVADVVPPALILPRRVGYSRP
jgi:hypothetical protein